MFRTCKLDVPKIIGHYSAQFRLTWQLNLHRIHMSEQFSTKYKIKIGGSHILVTHPLILSLFLFTLPLPLVSMARDETEWVGGVVERDDRAGADGGCQHQWRRRRRGDGDPAEAVTAEGHDVPS